MGFARDLQVTLAVNDNVKTKQSVKCTILLAKCWCDKVNRWCFFVVGVTLNKA